MHAVALTGSGHLVEELWQFVVENVIDFLSHSLLHSRDKLVRELVDKLVCSVDSGATCTERIPSTTMGGIGGKEDEKDRKGVHGWDDGEDVVFLRACGC